MAAFPFVLQDRVKVPKSTFSIHIESKSFSEKLTSVYFSAIDTRSEAWVDEFLAPHPGQSEGIIYHCWRHL